MQKHVNILLLEDSPSDAELIRRLLRGHASFKATVDLVGSLTEALESIDRRQHDLVITDLCLPDSCGLETITQLRTRSQQIPVIALTSDEADLGREAIRAGANDFIPKDQLSKMVLSRAVDYTIERFEMMRELKEANTLLETQNDRLAQSYKMAQQFVDNVSHEFRTPLTVIREFASIIRDGIDGPVTFKQQNRLSTLIARTDDLTLMVDDLLDTSRLKSGLLKTCRKVESVGKIVSQVEAMLKHRALAKKITFTTGNNLEDLKIFCDAEKLGRILINLVVNAIKFTPAEGKINISAELLESSRVKITVSDNGHGIPKDDLNRIFNRFQQVSAHERMASCKGFGLGLSIARSLAALNLGSLQVASVEGQGSQFSVLVPAARVDAILTCYLDQREALLSSEDEISVIEVRPNLNDLGDEAEVSAAVDDFLRSAVKSYDLVLQMEQNRWLVYSSTSEKTLHWLLFRFREEWAKLQRNYFGQQLPDLIYRTIETVKLPEGRQRLIEMGVSQKVPSWDTQTRESPTVKSIKRILVVDDESEVANAIESRLVANGFNVQTACCGQEGLQAAQETNPDAILLDIRMPEMDGLTVLDKLKSSPNTKLTPVIVLSASHQDQLVALDRGASFFVRKPFKSEAIIAALNSAILEAESNQS